MTPTDRALFAKLLTRLGILYDKTISTALFGYLLERSALV